MDKENSILPRGTSVEAEAPGIAGALAEIEKRNQVDCPRCEGAGEWEHETEDGVRFDARCSLCEGSGKVNA